MSGVECSSAVLCSCDFGAGDHAMVLESSKEASMELKIALSCWASRLLAGVGEVSLVARSRVGLSQKLRFLSIGSPLLSAGRRQRYCSGFVRPAVCYVDTVLQKPYM